MRRFRLWLAGRFWWPEVGEWQHHWPYNYMKRLTPDGIYEYREPNDAERAEIEDLKAW